MGELLYRLRCGKCDWHRTLRASTLAKIVRFRLAPYPDEPTVLLVCPKCKAVTLYDDRKPEAAGVLGESHQTLPLEHLIVFAIVAECADSNCDSLVQLTAIRSDDTSREMLLAEIEHWNLSDVSCPKCKGPLARPNPSELRWLEPL